MICIWCVCWNARYGGYAGSVRDCGYVGWDVYLGYIESVLYNRNVGYNGYEWFFGSIHHSGYDNEYDKFFNIF